MSLLKSEKKILIGAASLSRQTNKFAHKNQIK